MTALADRVATPVERADFDDLVTLVTQAPPWEKDRAAGVRVLLRAIGEGKADAPDQILARWTWRSPARRARRRTAAPARSSPRRSGCSARSPTPAATGTRRTSAQLVQVAKVLPLQVGAALLASAEGYTPRANDTLDQAREELGPIQEIANALADNLPAPKAPARKSRRAAEEAPRPAAGRVAALEAAERQRCYGRSAGSRAGDARERDGRRSRTPPSGRGLLLARAVVAALLAVALAQEARQLGGERVAGGKLLLLDELLDRVRAPLELLDVRRGLGIGRDRLAHLLGVRLLGLGELARRRLARRAGRRAARRALARRAGSARARRSAARPTTGSPTACSARRQASWSTPTMPVGPS